MRPAGRALVKGALKTALIVAICVGPSFASRAAERIERGSRSMSEAQAPAFDGTVPHL